MNQEQAIETTNINQLIEIEESNIEPSRFEAQSDREVQIVQSQVILAKKFPRVQHEVLKKIKNATDRIDFAKMAVYSYPKGGQVVTGPSIRTAEMLARALGNIDFGVKQISRSATESVMEVYAFDLENNLRCSRTFSVPHTRDTKKGQIALTGDRDIYEVTANQASRRLRACILQLVPGDIIQIALDNSYNTMKNGDKTPLIDRVQKIVLAFLELGVNAKDLEERLGHSVEQTTMDEFVELYRIFTSLKDNVTTRADWFKNYQSKAISSATQELNEKLTAKSVSS